MCVVKESLLGMKLLCPSKTLNEQLLIQVSVRIAPEGCCWDCPLSLFLYISSFPLRQPFSLFPTSSICSFSTKLPPDIFFMSVILWACPAVLFMLAAEHLNTICMALATHHMLQISDATCQVWHQNVENAVDAGRLPDELRPHEIQLALGQP